MGTGATTASPAGASFGGRAKDTPDQSSGTDQTAPAAGATTEKTTQSVLEEFQNFSAIQNGGPLPGLDEDRYIYRSGNLMRMQGDAAIPNYYVTDLTKQKSHFVTANACLAVPTLPMFAAFPSLCHGQASPTSARR